ncbi:MAG: nucleotidyltransferase substrate binding protein [Pseudomonadota bacterium]|nr:nucleotidyltransferase substrate binding protein [Pseudomonadota bacterium]
MTQATAGLRYKQLGDALARLKEAVEKPASTWGRTDVVVQRFEFTAELFWKVLKYALEQQKEEAPFPKLRLKKAFQAGWIRDEQIWLRILDDRNLTSHIYNEAIAAEIATRVPGYLSAMENLYAVLEKILELKQ